MNDEEYLDMMRSDEEMEELGIHELSSEEIKALKEERRMEIERKGFLPVNPELHEEMSAPIEDVEKNPRRFIIEECVPACQELWKKNIYTFMASDHLNEGVCWIEVIADDLSEENKKIYIELFGEDVVKFSYHKGCLNFGVESVGKRGQNRLLELAKEFKMQDVPHERAYLSIEEFLIFYCGCYDEVPNPEYREMKSPWELDDFDLDYSEKYEKWLDSVASKRFLKKFNPDKLTKPIEEYVKEHNMVVDGDRVYLSDYHYKKHLKYINSLGKDLGSSINM